MAADGRQYRECQAGQSEAVSAFDLLANAYDELLTRLAGNKKGSKQ